MKKRWRGIGSHLKCAAPSFPFFLRHVSNPPFVGVSRPHGSTLSVYPAAHWEKAKHHKVTQAAEPERSRRRFVPMISSFFPSSLSSPQHWSRLSERLIAALFQRRSFKYRRMSSKTASNGRTWHYIGSIKSGGNIPPKPPLLIHRYSH